MNQFSVDDDTRVHPEMTTHDHKIVICDSPMLEVGVETGKLVNVLLKLVFSRAWLRRDLNDSPNPVLLWQDEFQYFVTKRDNFALETSRARASRSWP